MSGRYLLKSSVAFAGAAAALAFSLSTTPVRAQGAYDGGGYGYGGAYQMGEVVVRPTPQRAWGTGARIDVVRAARVVRVADLDLNSRWGQRVARDRIERAAYDACSYLDERFVTLNSEGPGCYERAVDDGMSQIAEIAGQPLYGQG
ncbi:MAG TPA: UrcA family protein [Caulobacteraceae bacterium]|nr:UrcA family protein [Caulobacteraceae bacterium]